LPLTDDKRKELETWCEKLGVPSSIIDRNATLTENQTKILNEALRRLKERKKAYEDYRRLLRSFRKGRQFGPRLVVHISFEDLHMSFEDLLPLRPLRPLREATKIIGNLGELLLAYNLVTRRIKVARTDLAGFDLVVKDEARSLLSTSRLVGISVKTRGGKPSIPFPLKTIRDEAKKWNLVPYLSCVLIDENEAFLFPLEAADKLLTEKRKAISISKLRCESKKDKSIKRISLIPTQEEYEF